MPPSLPFALYVDRAQAEAALADVGELSLAELADLCVFLTRAGFPKATLCQRLNRKDYEVSHLLQVGRCLKVEVKHLLHGGRLTLGHARALCRIALAQQEAIARATISKKLRVRDVEALAKGSTLDALNRGDRAHFLALSEKVSEVIGQPVSILPRAGAANSGTITIAFDGHKGFEAVMERLRVPLESLF